MWLQYSHSEPMISHRKKKAISYPPPNLFDLLCSFVFSFRIVAFTKYPSLEEVEFISGQSFSEGTEEALIVGSVVDHEQDSGQQLIGYEQVVQVRPLVVPTAVATTPFHQGSEVISVPGEKFKLSPFNVNQALLVKPEISPSCYLLSLRFISKDVICVWLSTIMSPFGCVSPGASLSLSSSSTTNIDKYVSETSAYSQHSFI